MTPDELAEARRRSELLEDETRGDDLSWAQGVA